MNERWHNVSPVSDGEMLTAVLNHLDLPVATSDLDGRIVQWNQAVERLLGWPAEDAIGRTYSEFAVLPADRSMVDALRRQVADGIAWSGDLPAQKRDGSRLLAYCTSNVIRDDAGNRIGIVMTFQDAAQRRAQECERMLDSLLRNAPVAVATTNTELRLSRVNPLAERFLGAPERELLGRTLHDVVAEGAIELEALLRQVLDTGRTVENVEVWARSAHHGEAQCWLASYHRLHVESPDERQNGDMEPMPLGVGCFFTEVTDHKRAARATAVLEMQLAVMRRISRVSADCADPIEVLRVVIGLAQTDFADQVVVDLVHDRDLRRFAEAHDGGAETTTLHLPGGDPVHYGPDHPVQQAWESEEVVSQPGTHCVPICAHGRLLGIASFLRYERATFDHGSRAFAHMLAAEIGQALDTGRLLGLIGVA